jgi:hypothetical protein
VLAIFILVIDWSAQSGASECNHKQSWWPRWQFAVAETVAISHKPRETCQVIKSGSRPVILTTKTGPDMTRRFVRARLTSARVRPAREDHCRILTTKTSPGMTRKLTRARLRPASEDHWSRLLSPKIYTTAGRAVLSEKDLASGIPIRRVCKVLYAVQTSLTNFG